MNWHLHTMVSVWNEKYFWHLRLLGLTPQATIPNHKRVLSAHRPNWNEQKYQIEHLTIYEYFASHFRCLPISKATHIIDALHSFIPSSFKFRICFRAFGLRHQHTTYRFPRCWAMLWTIISTFFLISTRSFQGFLIAERCETTLRNSKSHKIIENIIVNVIFFFIQ